MFIALLPLAAAALQPPTARASLRLLTSTTASERAWHPTSNAHQLERVEILPDGRKVLLRITDHE